MQGVIEKVGIHFFKFLDTTDVVNCALVSK